MSAENEAVASVIIELQDKFSHASVAVTGALDRMAAKLKGFAAVQSPLAAALVKLQVAFASFGAIKNAIAQGTESIRIAERLRIALGKNVILYDSLSKSMEEMSKRSIFDDDQFKSAAETLLQMQVPVTELEGAMKAVASTAQATQRSLEGVAFSVGRTYQGMVPRDLSAALRGLKREQLEAGAAVAVLNKRYGEQAEAFAKTDIGKMAISQKRLNDAFKDFGKILVPLVAIIKEQYSLLAEKLLASMRSPIVQGFVKILESIVPLLAKIFDYVALIFAAQAGWKLILVFVAPTIALLGSLLAVVSLLVTAFTSLFSIGGLIVIAITAVGAAAFQASFGFKELWKIIKDFSAAFADVLKKAAEGKIAWSDVWTWLKAQAVAFVLEFKKAFQPIVKVFGEAFVTGSKVALIALNMLVSAFFTLADAVALVIDNIRYVGDATTHYAQTALIGLKETAKSAIESGLAVTRAIGSMTDMAFKSMEAQAAEAVKKMEGASETSQQILRGGTPLGPSTMTAQNAVRKARSQAMLGLSYLTIGVSRAEASLKFIDQWLSKNTTEKWRGIADAVISTAETRTIEKRYEAAFRAGRELIAREKEIEITAAERSADEEQYRTLDSLDKRLKFQLISVKRYIEVKQEIEQEGVRESLRVNLAAVEANNRALFELQNKADAMPYGAEQLAAYEKINSMQGERNSLLERQKKLQLSVNDAMEKGVFEAIAILEKNLGEAESAFNERRAHLESMAASGAITHAEATAGVESVYYNLNFTMDETLAKLEAMAAEPLVTSTQLAAIDALKEKLNLVQQKAAELVRWSKEWFAASITQGLEGPLTSFFDSTIQNIGNVKEAFASLLDDIAGQLRKFVASSIAKSFLDLLQPAVKATSSWIAGAIGGAVAGGAAEGGLIPGYAAGPGDNLLMGVRSGEYIQPQPAVDYYGTAVMNAMRRRLIPREVLSGFRAPSPLPSAFRAAGGPATVGMGGESTRIVPAIVASPDAMQALLSNSGTVLMDYLATNQEAARGALGISQ